MSKSFILRFREEWALWSVQKKIYGPDVWVEIDDIPDLSSKPNGLHLLTQELRRLETILLHDSIRGWISSVEEGNAQMHRLLLMIGAKLYAVDEGYRYYRKLAGIPEVPTDFLALVRNHRHKGAAHA